MDPGGGTAGSASVCGGERYHYIDGISLTDAAVSAHDFSVSMIPHTAEVTTLGSKKEGDIVNLETDIIGKYVEKLLHPQEEKKESHITREFLENCGF